MVQNYTWDEYFMTLAYLVSMKSKDPSTRVGAVIVGSDNEIRATGYNGFPRGVEDRPSRYEDKEYKYIAINHAEENAILHCARIGVSSKGCRMYTPWIPCCACTKSILQAGIVEVVYDANFPGNQLINQGSWEYSIQISKELMKEAGVSIRGFAGKILQIEAIYKGESHSLNYSDSIV